MNVGFIGLGRMGIGMAGVMTRSTGGWGCLSRPVSGLIS